MTVSLEYVQSLEYVEVFYKQGPPRLEVRKELFADFLSTAFSQICSHSIEDFFRNLVK